MKKTKKHKLKMPETIEAVNPSKREEKKHTINLGNYFNRNKGGKQNEQSA